MAKKVSLNNIVDEIEVLWNEFTAYLNKETGEIETISDDEVRLIEYENDKEELHEWQKERNEIVQKVLNSNEYLPLPTKFDINEYEIMKKFCYTIDNEIIMNELLHSISGKGAFRFFRNTIHQYGIENDWYIYKRSKIEKIIIEWLEINNIEYE